MENEEELIVDGFLIHGLGIYNPAAFEPIDGTNKFRVKKSNEVINKMIDDYVESSKKKNSGFPFSLDLDKELNDG